MPLVIITVREEICRESHCWALQECTTQALRAAGWSNEPWVQKIVRLPPAEFVYHPNPAPGGADVANFLLVEVLLLHSRPTPEKEAFWNQFRASVEEKLHAFTPDVVLGFVEVSGENLRFSRSALSP